MEDLSLHILDIAENSIAASAKNIKIKINEDKKKDSLTIEIKDDGEGMTEEMQKKVLDPFFTTKKKAKEIGLGLPLLAQAARATGGDIQINSKKGFGTEIKATFGYSHIDRQPLGDIGETVKVLIVSHPEIDFLYEHVVDDKIYILDTKKYGKELNHDKFNY